MAPAAAWSSQTPKTRQKQPRPAWEGALEVEVKGQGRRAFRAVARLRLEVGLSGRSSFTLTVEVLRPSGGKAGGHLRSPSSSRLTQGGNQKKRGRWRMGAGRSVHVRAIFSSLHGHQERLLNRNQRAGCGVPRAARAPHVDKTTGRRGRGRSSGPPETRAGLGTL